LIASLGGGRWKSLQFFSTAEHHQSIQFGHFPTTTTEETKEDVMQNQGYRGSRWRAVATLVLLVFAVTLGRVVVGQSQNKAQTLSAERTQTKVVLLGTGTPRPYPDRSGPATAIVW